jgi:two-component system KDP operon response regulator KdpE
MTGGAKVLVVDDEAQIRRFLRISLSAHGYDVIEAVRGEDAVAKCATETPALVILDLGLPDISGQEVISQIRGWSKVPIIILSVRADEAEKVEALDRGADDYVTKPFGIAELMARIRATLRARAAEVSQASEIKAGALTVDIARHRVHVNGQEIKLTKKEFDMLRVLAVNWGRVVTHQHLLKEVWGPAHVEDTHYLRTYVGHIRDKLGDDPAHPRFIESEPGVGYRLVQD